jgi:hypothetical protein
MLREKRVATASIAPTFESPGLSLKACGTSDLIKALAMHVPLTRMGLAARELGL